MTAMLALAIVVGTVSAHAQTNFDRPGGDYHRQSIRSGDPADCAILCERDRKCRAWSFNFPREGRPGADSAVCWLKNTVPARVRSATSVTGVRGAGVIEPHNRAVEMSIDRFGGDYRSFTLAADPDGAACRSACESDIKCRAWTYARPGYTGDTARCFLKNQIKPPHRQPGLMSGVVR